MMGENGRFGASGWGERRHVPIEYTALKILEYLAANEEAAFTVHHLMKIRGLGIQRRDRVRWIVDRFKKLGWVGAVDDKHCRITRRGKEVYRKIGRNMLDFIGVFRLEISVPSAWGMEGLFEPEELPGESFSAWRERKNGW